MDEADWLKQVVDKIASLGIPVDSDKVWKTPADWAAWEVVFVTNLDTESMTSAAEAVATFRHNTWQTDTPNMQVKLYAATLEPNRSGHYCLGFRLVCELTEF